MLGCVYSLCLSPFQWVHPLQCIWWNAWVWSTESQFIAVESTTYIGSGLTNLLKVCFEIRNGLDGRMKLRMVSVNLYTTRGKPICCSPPSTLNIVASVCYCQVSYFCWVRSTVYFMHCLSFQSAYFQTDNVAISCTMYSDCGFASNDWVFVVSPPMTVCLWFLPNGCVLVVSTPISGCMW